MSRLTFILVVILAPAILLAEPGDKALQFHMQQSQYVASGTIMSDITVHAGEKGTVTYTFRFQVSEYLHGSLTGGKQQTIKLNRNESGDGDTPPFMKKGAKCILFLHLVESHRGVGNIARVVDPWFGVQPYSSAMANRMKELTKQEK